MSSIASDVLPAASESPLALWKHEGTARPVRPQVAPQLVPTQRGLEIRIPIRRVEDIVSARRSGRLLARQMGCSGSRVALVLTAISELSRNILMYAGTGEIILSRSVQGAPDALIVVARDRGPGIADVSEVLERPITCDGSTSLGLSGLRLCMDRLDIASRSGFGTRVTCEVKAD